MHRLNQHPTGIICAGCQIAHPMTDSRPLTPEEIAEIEPPHRCIFCGEFLLEAGRVKRDLEALGFAFVTHANWSAWMRSRPLHGAFDKTELAISTVDFLVCPDWHAPLDSEDGAVILKRCATWPLVQPGAGEKVHPNLRPYLGELSLRPFHWVQEHEAIPADDVLAMISLLQGEGA